MHYGLDLECANIPVSETQIPNVLTGRMFKRAQGHEGSMLLSQEQGFDRMSLTLALLPLHPP